MQARDAALLVPDSTSVVEVTGPNLLYEGAAGDVEDLPAPRLLALESLPRLIYVLVELPHLVDGLLQLVQH